MMTIPAWLPTIQFQTEYLNVFSLIPRALCTQSKAIIRKYKRRAFDEKRTCETRRVSIVPYQQFRPGYIIWSNWNGIGDKGLADVHEILQ